MSDYTDTYCLSDLLETWEDEAAPEDAYPCEDEELDDPTPPAEESCRPINHLPGDWEPAYTETVPAGPVFEPPDPFAL